MFCKKIVLRNFVKFTGKQLCPRLPYNKAAGLRLCHRCFPVNFVKFLRTPFLQNTFRWLLFSLVQTRYFYDEKVATFLSWMLHTHQVRCCHFFIVESCCLKCEFDTDVKIKNYFHYDEDQLLFCKKVHIETKSIKQNVLVIFLLLQETKNSNLFDK